MEVIKTQLQKDDMPPPVAPHAPAHGVLQPVSLIGAHSATNNTIDLKKNQRSVSNVGIMRQTGLATSS